MNRGLTLFVRRPEAQQLHYRLLRRFEHQSFDFYLDGQLVGSLPAQTPGTLLVGQFKLPQADSPGVRSVSVSSRAPASPIKLATTAQDSPDVQFYVQQLNVTAEGTAAGCPGERAGRPSTGGHHGLLVRLACCSDASAFEGGF